MAERVGVNAWGFVQMRPNRTVTISGHQIGEFHPCFIVAEVGTNHEGDLGTAIEMIQKTKEAGADAVKFQSFLADELVPRKHPEYDYLKKTEIPRDWYPKLLETAKREGIILFSTASNYTTLGWMEELDFPCYKIASGNLTHLPLIRRAAQTGKPLIMSTGYSDIEDIYAATKCVLAEGNKQFVLLHCVGNYPTEQDEVNLASMEMLRRAFQCPVGYSDHTNSDLCWRVAVCMGANVMEKHVSTTPDKRCGDHVVSEYFSHFGWMVGFVRDMEKVRGAAYKPIGKRERQGALAARRVLYAARHIPAGTIITEDMVLYLRPDGRTESMTGKPYGLSPEAIKWVSGRKAVRPIEAQSPIQWQDLEIVCAE